MTVGSYPTLVKALKIRSIGVGGDSALHVSSEGVHVGPDRKGPSLAACKEFGGAGCEVGATRGSELPPEMLGRTCAPALTDVLNTMGLSEFGDVRASRSGIERLCAQRNHEPEELCERAARFAADKIRSAVDDLLAEINEKPVYTISELLEGKKVEPKRAYVMGGPAAAMAGLLENALGMEVIVPEHFAVANAIGAALTRTTMDLELFADTRKRRLIVPSLDHEVEIERNYDLEEAKKDAVRLLKERLERLGVTDGPEPEITDEGSFNMVEGFRTVGRNIRVKCQIRPSAEKLSPKSNE
jgi:N-methylhydantoinase A/oxoprolinase/acetone carboxylase beta subunit